MSRIRHSVMTGELYTRQLNEQGYELLDPTPMEPPVGYRRTEPLAQQIKRMIREERLAQELAKQGIETFEEADDFDVGDDFDPTSPYEETFDPDPLPASPQPAPEAPAEGGEGVASPTEE